MGKDVGKLFGFWDPVPHVVVEIVGEMGLVYWVRPGKGGKERVLHRNALKRCSAPEVEVIVDPNPSNVTPAIAAQDSVPHSVWIASAVESVNVGNDIVRSTPMNFCLRPTRYRD